MAKDIFIKNNIADFVKFMHVKLRKSEKYKILDYTLNGEVYHIVMTELNGLSGYNCFISTNYVYGQIFIFLSDIEVNQGCHLLAFLDCSVKNGKKYNAEQVITLSNKYLNDKGFSALIFLQPEDLGVFGELTSDLQFESEKFNALTLLPLKKIELEGYRKEGFDAIIKMFESEYRDFLSVL